jgi:hypothetical protein
MKIRCTFPRFITIVHDVEYSALRKPCIRDLQITHQKQSHPKPHDTWSEALQRLHGQVVSL